MGSGNGPDPKEKAPKDDIGPKRGGSKDESRRDASLKTNTGPRRTDPPPCCNSPY